LPKPESDIYRLKGRRDVNFTRAETAVLIIDPVNDFLSEGGAAWDLARSTVEKNDVVGKLKRLMEGARARAVPVLFAPMAFTEEDYASEQLQRRSGIGRIMFERKMFAAGSWGADFHPDLTPTDDDTVLLPHKGTDVFETDLPQHLERLGTTHLVIAGMAANLCCEGTGRHATEHGYDVTFLSDAIGAENLPAYEAAIHLNYPLIGNAVLEVDELLSALDASPDDARPQAGDTVLGSDRGRIGTVEEIHDAAGGQGEYMLVRRGVVLDHDTYIPLDAVVKRAETTVFVNVPKLVVGKLPWDRPPSRDELRAKLGTPGRDVDTLYGTHDPSAPS
jgi:ureidoacrylate peracid hydrolase